MTSQGLKDSWDTHCNTKLKSSNDSNPSKPTAQLLSHFGKTGLVQAKREVKLAFQDWLWLAPSTHIMTFQKSPRLLEEDRLVACRVWASPNFYDSNLTGRSLIPAQECGRDRSIENHIHTELVLPSQPRLVISLEWWTAQHWHAWLGLKLHQWLNLLDDNERHQGQGYVQDLYSIEYFRVFFFTAQECRFLSWPTSGSSWTEVLQSLLSFKTHLWN